MGQNISCITDNRCNFWLVGGLNSSSFLIAPQCSSQFWTVQPWVHFYLKNPSRLLKFACDWFCSVWSTGSSQFCVHTEKILNWFKINQVSVDQFRPWQPMRRCKLGFSYWDGKRFHQIFSEKILKMYLKRDSYKNLKIPVAFWIRGNERKGRG